LCFVCIVAFFASAASLRSSTSATPSDPKPWEGRPSPTRNIAMPPQNLDVPVYPQARYDTLSFDTPHPHDWGAEVTQVTRFRTGDPAQSVVSYYMEAFQKAGWEIPSWGTCAPDDYFFEWGHYNSSSAVYWEELIVEKASSGETEVELRQSFDPAR
jgi:hypothetical protein